ncbi:hypothetical protein HS1genome_1880 [Sulfodiicoccus acidiphilus]|uniref:Uncharacterized protein n=1 Tax=Sulfodiicoccus acidiphilus TaxID=1670455 RepID=A0A348B5N9_9CREN|nr:hypothetical protein HS1genome_1880 [Sulfodiicoccus acidiphilus]GGT92774.1 hypothetical protein GCM10007116_08190 [Sulfodiicoccus acidiphilus]
MNVVRGKSGLRDFRELSSRSARKAGLTSTGSSTASTTRSRWRTRGRGASPSWLTSRDPHTIAEPYRPRCTEEGSSWEGQDRAGKLRNEVLFLYYVVQDDVWNLLNRVVFGYTTSGEESIGFDSFISSEKGGR